MKIVVSDPAVELLSTIASGIGTAILTLFGTIIEHAAIQRLTAGQLVLGAWEAVIGTLALVVGLYFLGYGDFVPRCRRLLQSR